MALMFPGFTESEVLLFTSLGVLGHRLCAVQVAGQFNQLHKLAAVTVYIGCARIAGKFGDIRIAETIQKCAAPQFLAECRNRCRKIEAVTAAVVDTAVQQRRLDQL